MATLVCFHAHPDDEAIATGGLMARAKAEGHRVVLVVATRGEHGEVAAGFLDTGEALGLRRVSETLRSAELLGVDRVEFLGYVDSGMIGTPTNDGPYSFWRADVEHAAHRLGAILDEESAGVLTVYDHHGGYGHPDHIQVHRVGVAAAATRPALRLYENTMNRDAIAAAIAENTDTAAEWAGEGELPEIDTSGFGMPESAITHAIDVVAFTGLKREAMRAHASQITDEDFFMKMPEEIFARSFGTEWFIAHGRNRAEGAPMETDLFT